MGQKAADDAAKQVLEAFSERPFSRSTLGIVTSDETKNADEALARATEGDAEMKAAFRKKHGVEWDDTTSKAIPRTPEQESALDLVRVSVWADDILARLTD